MGTDSRDLFAELTCRFPEKNARWSLAYDRSEHSLSGPVRETEHELSLNVHLNVAENADLALTYGYSWIDNVENVSGAVLRSHAAGWTITRRF
jgi:hypothetical protein